MSDTGKLLPNNATSLEIALARLSGRVDELHEPIDALWDTERCPEPLLGYLAWGLSVDVWDSSWDASVKRQVLSDSVIVHRQKGTVGAVRRALGALGFTFDIKEWWEDGSDPHTFRVDAFASDILEAGIQISPKLAALADELIRNVKPARSHYTLRIGEKRGGSVFASAGSRQQRQESRTVTPALPVELHTSQISARSGQRQVGVSRQIHSFNMGGLA